MSKRNRNKKRAYRYKLNSITNELKDLEGMKDAVIKENITRCMDMKKIPLKELTDDDILVFTLPNNITMTKWALNIVDIFKIIIPNYKPHIIFLPKDAEFSVEKRDELIEKIKNINVREES